MPAPPCSEHKAPATKKFFQRKDVFTQCFGGCGESEISLRVGFQGRRYALIHGSGAAVERDDLQGPARVQSAKRLPWGYWGSLEALLICDRTAARSDMGRCRRGEVILRL